MPSMAHMTLGKLRDLSLEEGISFQLHSERDMQLPPGNIGSYLLCPLDAHMHPILQNSSWPRDSTGQAPVWEETNKRRAVGGVGQGQCGDPLLLRGHWLLRPPQHQHSCANPWRTPAHRARTRFHPQASSRSLSALVATPGVCSLVCGRVPCGSPGAGVCLCLLGRPLSIWPSSWRIPMLPASSQDPTTQLSDRGMRCAPAGSLLPQAQPCPPLGTSLP